MAERFSPSRILKILRNGPSTGESPSAHQVKIASEKYPEQYARVLGQLYYQMADRQFKAPGKNLISEYERFARSWRMGPDDTATQFYLGLVDAYHYAAKNKFFELDWESSDLAPAIVKSLLESMPQETSAAQLAWLVLLGQLQSTYSRDDAAQTFTRVQEHAHASLIADFYWDTGSLTYFSENYISRNRRVLPSLGDMETWKIGPGVGSDHAIVVSMDPNFFRIYAPMILFNAQQLPEQDFVIILCASSSAAKELCDDVDAYFLGLAGLNRQAAPSNIRLHAVNTPAWVGNERTFYACARFLAIPDLLEEYKSVYSIDADLFLLRDPKHFLASTASTILGFPKTQGLLGVPPWRRFMAGNLVAGRGATDSKVLQRMFDYLSVGLRGPKTWMLDQNALTYAVEGAGEGEYTPVTRSRPTSVGSFMANWERNFKAATAG